MVASSDQKLKIDVVGRVPVELRREPGGSRVGTLLPSSLILFLRALVEPSSLRGGTSTITCGAFVAHDCAT